MKKIILSVIFLLMALQAYAVQYESPILRVALLNHDPDPARTGDTLTMRFRVENAGGGTVKEVQLEIMQNYPFTVIDGPAMQELGTLYEYQTDKNYVNAEFKLKVDKDAVNGRHELKIRYREKNGEWITASFDIGISSKEFAQIIYVDKAKVQPGKETEMKFTVTNIGSAPLQNLVFTWSESNGVLLPVFSDDTKYIKYLDVGQSIELKYIVIADVNAKPGLYSLDLSLKYESLINSTSSLIKTKAGIFVGGETDFDVAFSQSTQGQTSLSVANTGNTPAQSVSVIVPQQENFRIQGSNSVIIGNLDKGDYTVVSFQITQNTGNFTRQRQGQTNQNGFAGRNNNLRVIIDYTDTTGERRSVEKNVSIQFRTDTTAATARTTQTSFFSGWTFYGIVAAAILLLFAFRKKISSAIKKK